MLGWLVTTIEGRLSMNNYIVHLCFSLVGLGTFLLHLMGLYLNSLEFTDFNVYGKGHLLGAALALSLCAFRSVFSTDIHKSRIGQLLLTLNALNVILIIGVITLLSYLGPTAIDSNLSYKIKFLTLLQLFGSVVLYSLITFFSNKGGE